MVSNGNVTGLVARLAREGTIVRRPSPTDGRVQMVCLTSKGERTLAAMIPEHHAWLAELFAAVPPDEQKRLHELVGALKSSVERAAAPGEST
jgi:DNA-binding MarR family transcriptional regulator